MQPIIEPDRVRMAEKALIIRIARKQLSMTLMSLQLCTVKGKMMDFISKQCLCGLQTTVETRY